MERCPNCGASIRTGARFCTACGFRLLQPSGAPTTSPTAVTSTETDAPVVPTQASSGDSSSSDPGRVVWQGDSQPALADDGNLEARDPGQSEASPVVDEIPAIASDGAPALAQDDPAIDRTSGTWPSEHDRGSTLAGTPITASETVISSGPDSPADDDLLDPADQPHDTKSDSVNRIDSAEPDPIDDERLDIDQASIQPVDAADGSRSYEETGLLDSPDDHVSPEIETGASDLEPSSANTETGQRDDAESVERGENAEASAKGSAPLGDGSHDSGSAAENASTGEGEPSPESSGWQDDVVIDNSFMAETDQPGYFNADGERPSLTGDIERESDAELALPDASSDDAGLGTEPSADDDLVTESTSAEAGPDPSSGRDDDWEPWGTGGADDSDSDGDRPGDANRLPIGQTSALQREQPGGGSDAVSGIGISQARALLEQLRVAIDSLEAASPPPAIDSGKDLAVDSMAEIGQILDGIPSSTIEADRLAELTRLAEDLTGRDFDIRALQRFAEERETILNLATEVQQQRDVIDQIRSVLGQSRL